MNATCLESTETYLDLIFFWIFVQNQLKDILVEVFLKYDNKQFLSNFFWTKMSFV